MNQSATAVLPVLFGFLKAGTPAKRRACIAAHPELLEPAADAALAELADEARRAGRADIAVKLSQCRSQLAQARAASGDAQPPGSARPRSSSDDGVPPVSQEASRLLTAFRSLGPAADPQRQADVLRPLLRLIDPHVHARLWAALQGGLGNALAQLSDRARNGDYSQAIAAFEAAQEGLAGKSSPQQWLQNAHQLGRIYSRHRPGDPGHNLEMAIGYLTEALSPGEGSLPPPQWADAHSELAEAYLRRIAGKRADNIESAIEHLRAAAEVFTRRDHPAEWAHIQCSLGIAFRERIHGERADNIDRAITCFKKAYNPATRNFRPLIYARASGGLGTAYLARVTSAREDDIEQAINCFTEARAILTKHGLTAERAVVQHNLGNAYLQRIAGTHTGNIESAIDCLNDALRIRTENTLPLERAATKLALGNACLRRGQGERAENIEMAIREFRDAEAIFARFQAARQRAATLLSLADGYAGRIIGDEDVNIERAIACLRAAYTVFTAEGMVTEQAAALTGLGNAVSEQTTRDQAETLGSAIGYHLQALKTLGDSRTSPELWASIHNNLGTAHLARQSATHDDLSSAIACFREALRAGSGTRSSLQQAMTHHNLGAAYAERASNGDAGDLRKAIAQFTAALKVFDAIGTARHRHASSQALGDAYTRLGEHWQEALNAYLNALGAADDMYVSSLRPEAREAELAEARGLHPRAAFAAARTGDFRQAAEILERGRARGLGEAVARDAAELDDVCQQDRELASAFLAAARDLRELEGMDWPAAAGTRSRTAGSGPLTGDRWAGTGSDHDLRQRLEAARNRLTEAVMGIRRLPGHDRFLVQPGFREIAATAARTGPIAYLAVTGAGSLTLLVTSPAETPAGEGSDGPGAEWVPEPAQPLTSMALGSLLIKRDDSGAVIGGYLPAQRQLEDNPLEFLQELPELLPFLGERLIAPLAGALSARHTDSVTLVACGLLGLLPLHAAAYQRNGQPRCLLDDYAVAYTPSARVLATAHSKLAAGAGSPPVLAGAGDPESENALPLARAELKEISAHFQRPRALYGSQATKAALLEMSRGATYVHFACHGRFDPVTPRDSALLLAGDEQEGLLTLREVAAQRPFATARLVVASACETAFTDFTDLPDEVIGLPAGFLQGETPGVVGTLWSVYDVSTAFLMTRFYEYHLGQAGSPAEPPMPPAEALRRAQLWLARATAGELEEYLSRHPALREAGAKIPRRAQPYGHPFYWAPFVIVGI